MLSLHDFGFEPLGLRACWCCREGHSANYCRREKAGACKSMLQLPVHCTGEIISGTGNYEPLNARCSYPRLQDPALTAATLLMLCLSGHVCSLLPTARTPPLASGSVP
eukprot:2319939-Amphidinium_carterae.1